MRILVFGDSIVEGAFDTNHGSWVNQLAAYARLKTIESDFDSDISFFNLGISGDCTNRLLDRFSSEAETRLHGKEGVIMFSIGVNDTQRYVNDNTLKTTPEQFAKNIQELILQARKLTSSILFLGILPIVEEMVQPMPWANNRSHFQNDIEEFDEIIKKVTEAEGVAYIPMQDIFSSQNKKYLIDGIHPDAKGHQLIFERVKSSLKKQGIL